MSQFDSNADNNSQNTQNGQDGSENGGYDSDNSDNKDLFSTMPDYTGEVEDSGTSVPPAPIPKGDEAVSADIATQLSLLLKASAIKDSLRSELVGFSQDVQALILYKSALKLCEVPMNFSILHSLMLTILRFVGPGLDHHKYAAITFASTDEWLIQVGIMSANTYAFRDVYTQVLEILFTKSTEVIDGLEHTIMRSHHIDVDITYGPYYVSAVYRSSNKCEIINPPLKFPSKWNLSQRLMWLFGHALLFKRNDSAKKKFSLEAMKIDVYSGSSSIPLIASPSKELVQCMNDWINDANDVTVNFYKWVYHLATKKEFAEPSVEYKQVVAKSYLVLEAWRQNYPMVAGVAKGDCMTMESVLKQMRKLRKGSMLDAGFAKDGGSVMFAKCGDGWVVGRTVIEKIIPVLGRLSKFNINTLIYAGVANAGNYQMDYVNQWCDQRKIKFLAFDKVARAGVVQADATDVESIRKLVYGVKKYAVISDIDITQDNSIPQAVAKVFGSVNGDENSLVALYHKATVLAALPKLDNGFAMRYITVRDKGITIIPSPRGHNGETYVEILPSGPKLRDQVIPPISSVAYNGTELEATALAYRKRFVNCNFYRGVEFTGNMASELAFVPVSSLYQYEFKPKPQLKAKRLDDDFSDFVKSNTGSKIIPSYFHADEKFYVVFECPAGKVLDFVQSQVVAFGGEFDVVQNLQNYHVYVSKVDKLNDFGKQVYNKSLMFTESLIKATVDEFE